MDLDRYSFVHAKRDFDNARQGIVPEGWELYIDSEVKGNGVKVWRKAADSGLYLYKMVGRMLNSNAELFAGLFDDLEYRDKWDIYTHSLSRVAEVDPVLIDPENPEGDKSEKGSIIQWRVKFNFPFISDREYLFVRHSARIEDTIIFLDKQSNEHDTYPPKKGITRLETYNNAISLLQDGDDVIMSQDYLTPLDLKMSLPTWLLNWAAGSGVKSVIGLYKESLDKYPAWKEKNAAK